MIAKQHFWAPIKGTFYSCQKNSTSRSVFFLKSHLITLLYFSFCHQTFCRNLSYLLWCNYLHNILTLLSWHQELEIFTTSSLGEKVCQLLLQITVMQQSMQNTYIVSSIPLRLTFSVSHSMLKEIGWVNVTVNPISQRKPKCRDIK